jgi:hypothetical protein
MIDFLHMKYSSSEQYAPSEMFYIISFHDHIHLRLALFLPSPLDQHNFQPASSKLKLLISLLPNIPSFNIYLYIFINIFKICKINHVIFYLKLSRFPFALHNVNTLSFFNNAMSHLAPGFLPHDTLA